MEGLATLLQSVSELCAPVLQFLIWLFPFKIYKLHDGQRGVICTFGRVRKYRFFHWMGAERGPGITICGPCEDLVRVQAVGGYIDLPEQVLTTKDEKVVVANGAIIYTVHSVQQAVLQTENHEYVISGVAMDLLRQWARNREWEDILDSDKLTASLAGKINKKIACYGCTVDRLLFTDLRPHNVQMGCDAARQVAAVLVSALFKKPGVD